MPDHERPTFFLVPHTHWEGAVFQTREQYLRMGLSIILRALALLEEHPDYRFTLDQRCYVQPFLERHPEAAESFRRFVREGRLALVGGTVSMFDGNMPGPESYVRQLLLGKRWFREALGVEVTVGWQLDTFGHHAQTPQLLRQAGIESFWFFRGMPGWDEPSEFLWEGLDGLCIPAVWLQQGYCVGYRSPASMPEFGRFMEGEFGQLDPQSRPECRVGLVGADVAPPEEHLPAMVAAYNAQPDAALELRLATPDDYLRALPEPAEWEILHGERNPIFQGIYSSRIEVKQHTRECECLLLGAEKLGSVLRALGRPVDDSALERAWDPVLFNQAHDLMSGVMTDQVWEDSLRGFDFARQTAHDALTERLHAYVERIDTRGEGVPVVVVNTLAESRTDAVVVRLGLAAKGAHGLRVTHPSGVEAPHQIIAAELMADGSIVEADVAFVARDIPGLGHAVYHVASRVEPEAGSLTQTVGEGAVDLETEQLRLTCDPLTGVVTSLVLKADGWEALRGPANVIVQEPDAGDFWEPYRTLDGASRIQMTEEHPLPPRGAGVFSDEHPAESATVTRGPVFSEVTAERALGERSRLETTIRLWEGLPRVEFRTRIVNGDTAVRYRAAFPVSVSQGARVDAIPFGSISRPAGVEYPAQGWVDLGDGTHGLALLNRGLPGHSMPDDTILLSLMRSTRIVAYGFGGGYGPGMGSDTGLELGRQLTFEYALVPHAGAWAETGGDAVSDAYGEPPLAVSAAQHGGTLPARWGFLEVTPPTVRVTALKPGPDGATVLRLYEAAGDCGRTTRVRVRATAPIVRAEASDLLERPTGALPVTDGAVTLELGAFKIRTVRLWFG